MTYNINLDVLLGRPASGGTTLKEIWPGDEIFRRLSQLGVINGVAQTASPGDTKKLWLDTAAGLNAPATWKNYKGGVWSAASAGAIAAHFGTAADVTKFGATGDGTTDDTAAVFAAMNSGHSTIVVPAGTYVVDPIAVPATVSAIYGPGTLKQRAENQRVLTVTGHTTGLRICNLGIEGLAGTDLGIDDHGTSADMGIQITSSSNVIVTGCTFSRVLVIALYFVDSSWCSASENFIDTCGYGIYYKGCDYCTAEYNRLKDTCYADTVFTIGISLESTDGNPYGICNYITVRGNIVTGRRNCQGIMAHAVNGMVIDGNLVVDALLGITIVPFNATDTSQFITISGNVLVPDGGSTFSGWAGGGDGITCQSGVGLPAISNVTISGNSVYGVNQVFQEQNVGGIRLGWVNNVTVTGNTVRNVARAACVLGGTCINVIIDGNAFADTELVSGEQYGIKILAETGPVTIKNNMFRNMGTAIRHTSTAAVFLQGNHYDACTLTVSDAGGAMFSGRVRTVTDPGTTLEMGDVDVIFLTAPSSTTINAFSNVIPGHIYRLVFGDSDITVNRDNATLPSGANFNGTPGDVLTLIGVSTTDVTAQSSAINS